MVFVAGLPRAEESAAKSRAARKKRTFPVAPEPSSSLLSPDATSFENKAKPNRRSGDRELTGERDQMLERKKEKKKMGRNRTSLCRRLDVLPLFPGCEPVHENCSSQLQGYGFNETTTPRAERQEGNKSKKRILFRADSAFPLPSLKTSFYEREYREKVEKSKRE